MSKTPSKTKQKLTKKSAPRAKPKVIKTIQSWFEKDENGKVNKVAITVFCFLAVYPPSRELKPDCLQNMMYQLMLVL